MEVDNRERNLRKKLRLLQAKEATEEINSKIDKIKEDLVYYDNIKKIREKNKIKLTVQEKTSDDFLEEAYQENRKYWEEARKKQEERRSQQKKQEEKRKKQKKQKEKKESKKEYYEEVKSFFYRNENIEKISQQIKQEFKVVIPKNIKDFISNRFDKEEYHKLVKEYHPDKKKYEPKLCELFTQLINEHKN